MDRGTEVRFDVKEPDRLLCGAPEVISSEFARVGEAASAVV
jgi:hypothetical protein